MFLYALFGYESCNGVATLSATTFLSLNFSYPTVNGTTYDILTATSISGTIPTGNISFTNTGSGNVTAVTVTYPGGNIVRVTVNGPTSKFATHSASDDEGPPSVRHISSISFKLKSNNFTQLNKSYEATFIVVVFPTKIGLSSTVS